MAFNRMAITCLDVVLSFILSIFLTSTATVVEAIENSEANSQSKVCGKDQCNPLSEYCDNYESTCKSCVDICVMDISQFEKCSEFCQPYLRDVIFRRIDSIQTIHTLLAAIILITSVILLLLLGLLFLKLRSRKQTRANNSKFDEGMQMKKLQELEARQMNGYVNHSTSPKHLPLAKGTSMQTMTTGISLEDGKGRSNIAEDEDNNLAMQTRRRQTSSSTNNGGNNGSKRSYQSSSRLYEQISNRKASEDRVPQPLGSNGTSYPPTSSLGNGAYDNPAASRSPTPTSSSNQTIKGPSPNRTALPPIMASPESRGSTSSTRLPPRGAGYQLNGAPLRSSPYTISHSQVI